MSALKNLFWNPEESRPRAGWRILAQFVAAQGAGLILTSLVAGSLGPAVGIAALQEGRSSVWLFLMFLGIIPLTMRVGSVWLAGRYLDRRPFVEFGFHLDRDWWGDLGLGLALGGLLMTLVFVVQLAAGWVTVVDVLRSGGPGRPFAPGILVLLLTFILAGFSEELVFRGYQLTNLAEGFNSRVIGPRRAITLGWLLSSVVFGLLHALNPNASLASTLNIMFSGVVLGAGYVLTGELALSIGLHISWNFSQANVFGFPVSGLSGTSTTTFIATAESGPDLWTGGSFGPEAGLLGLLASLLGALLIAGWVRARRGELELYVPLAELPTSPGT